MATIVFNGMGVFVTDYVLGGSGGAAPPASWTMGLSTTPVGSGSNMGRQGVWNVTPTANNFAELATTTAAGYVRPTIAKTINQAGVDWGTSAADNTFSTGGQSTTADQVTFSFTGAPSPNGAQSWVLTTGSTLQAGTAYFAADTAATRTFANGDTEKVTATLKAG